VGSWCDEMVFKDPLDPCRMKDRRRDAAFVVFVLVLVF